MAGYWPSSFFFCVFMDRDEIECMKTQKRNSANIQPSWPNKLGQERIYYKDKAKKFRFILKKESIIRAGKKANCVYSTINPQQSFVFSLVWLSSAAFCDTIADIVQKLRIFHATIKAGNPKRARWAHVANQNTGFASYCLRTMPVIWYSMMF